jgi:predicted glycosyltransferase involved in capsule biosynthesis
VILPKNNQKFAQQRYDKKQKVSKSFRETEKIKQSETKIFKLIQERFLLKRRKIKEEVKGDGDKSGNNKFCFE